MLMLTVPIEVKETVKDLLTNKSKHRLVCVYNQKKYEAHISFDDFIVNQDNKIVPHYTIYCQFISEGIATSDYQKVIDRSYEILRQLILNDIIIPKQSIK